MHEICHVEYSYLDNVDTSGCNGDGAGGAAGGESEVHVASGHTVCDQHAVVRPSCPHVINPRACILLIYVYMHMR